MLNRFLNLSWEGQAILAVFTGMVVLPLITGWLLIRCYRYFYPVVTEDDPGFVTRVPGQEDGFFKKLLIGWVIWGPVTYWFYQTYLM